MKYLKYFESYNEPKVGDYVWCEDISSHREYSEHKKSQIKVNEFLSKNIGKVISKSIDLYKIAYDFDYLPDDVLGYCFYKEYNSTIKHLLSNKNVKVFDNGYTNICAFNLKEIKYFSSNKEDVDIQMSLNKYNI